VLPEILHSLRDGWTADRSWVLWALGYSAACHLLFLAGVGAMIWAMYHGMSRSFGSVPSPWNVVINAILLLQFPLAHSFLLTQAGQTVLKWMAPRPHSGTLATTTYAIVASVQLLLLFLFWTPSGTVWWQASGFGLWLLTVLYGASWLLPLKATADAGIQLQTGMLGWYALLRSVRPRFPDMPTTGLFRWVRQPIYVAFALTLWSVPTWTPDQLAVAISYTAYCVVAPLHKERRFSRLFGERFARYRKAVPYWIPGIRRG
jgi:protein-S-isoprenylcysteine O-methyltransferase Ste14